LSVRVRPREPKNWHSFLMDGSSFVVGLEPWERGRENGSFPVVEADRFSGRRNRKVLKRGEAARTPTGSSSAILIAERSPTPGAKEKRVK
jgi:hypothetical protein